MNDTSDSALDCKNWGKSEGHLKCCLHRRLTRFRKHFCVDTWMQSKEAEKHQNKKALWSKNSSDSNGQMNTCWSAEHKLMKTTNVSCGMDGLIRLLTVIKALFVCACVPEDGVMGAATSPLTLKAAICCICAAAMAAIGFRYEPCVAAMSAACCCMICCTSHTRHTNSQLLPFSSTKHSALLSWFPVQKSRHS